MRDSKQRSNSSPSLTGVDLSPAASSGNAPTAVAAMPPRHPSVGLHSGSNRAEDGASIHASQITSMTQAGATGGPSDGEGQAQLPKVSSNRDSCSEGHHGSVTDAGSTNGSEFEMVLDPVSSVAHSAELQHGQGGTATGDHGAVGTVHVSESGGPRPIGEALSTAPTQTSTESTTFSATAISMQCQPSTATTDSSVDQILTARALTPQEKRLVCLIFPAD